MFRDGYEATGIQGVVDAAHVPRGSFFHHFPSKEHLGIVVLQRYARASEQRQIAAFENEEQSPTERLRSFFAAANDRVIADDFTKGCLIGNFTLQLSNTSEPIRQALVQAADETIDRSGRVLQAAKDAGELDPDVDPCVDIRGAEHHERTGRARCLPTVGYLQPQRRQRRQRRHPRG